MTAFKRHKDIGAVNGAKCRGHSFVCKTFSKYLSWREKETKQLGEWMAARMVAQPFRMQAPSIYAVCCNICVSIISVILEENISTKTKHSAMEWGFTNLVIK